MKGIYEIRRDNLLRIIKERYEGSQTKLADALGVRPNYISRLCTSSKNIGDELARKLEYITELTKHWLDQDHVQRGLAAGNLETVLEESKARRRVPLVSWASVAISRLKTPPALDDNADSMRSPVDCSNRTVLLRVKGVSMLPRFQEGDLVFADPEADPFEHQGFCLAIRAGDEEPVLRQLVQEAGRKYLRALNTAFPEPMIKVDEQVEILAAVVCKVEVV
jgi:SOS-response transcriptional repressor LexA